MADLITIGATLALCATLSNGGIQPTSYTPDDVNGFTIVKSYNRFNAIENRYGYVYSYVTIYKTPLTNKSNC